MHLLSITRYPTNDENPMRWTGKVDTIGGYFSFFIPPLISLSLPSLFLNSSVATRFA